MTGEITAVKVALLALCFSTVMSEDHSKTPYEVCLKIQISKCSCEISAGEKNITDDPSRVFVVLNCSFPGSNFDAVLWTRNEQPVGQNEIYRDLQKNKKWSAVALTKIPNYEKYQCGMKRGEENCSVSPGKPKLRNLPLVKIVNQHYSSEIGDCTVDAGWPRPDVSWWRNGLQLRDGHDSYSIVINNYSSKSSQLKILAIREYQHGTYTCRADNIFGTSERKVMVMVKRSDLIKWESGGGIDSIVALEGTNITLECTCKKNECKKKTATAYWKFKDRNINQSDRIKLSKVTTNGGVKIIVTILNLSGNDSGEYGCGINTSLGFGEETRRLHVLMKVSIQVSVSPVTQTVFEGHATIISCKATGAPKLKITWKFKDGDLPSGINVSTTDEGSILQTRNTTKRMEGSFKCTATNKVDSADSTATVRVLGIPTAEVGPNPHPTLVEGDTLRLTCKVSESASEIKWKKNGDLVTSKALGSKEGDKNDTLVITNVDTDDSGYYFCEAHNQAGSSSSSVEIRVRGKIFEWYYIVGPLSAVIIITFVSWYICKRRMTVRKAKAANPDEELGYELEEMDREVDKWEISRDRIVLRKVIGSGAFGVVWKGSLKEAGAGLKRQVIAAKCLTPTSGAEGRKALLKEIELGKQLQDEPQPNIITFVGCVTTRIHPILVMEYLPCGDLLGYLRKSRGIEDKYHCGEGEAAELSTYDLVSFARQIATGMVFLGSRGIVHRDLAARNVLLDKNCVCKITDFGLAYQSFKYGHGNAKKGRIPIKWTAPEILYGNPASLSSQSDVWSYGIVLYEIFTIGGIPYQGWTEGQTIAEIKGGYRMPKPAHIDETLYNVMTRCWHETPEFRPHFEPLRRKMIKYIEEELYTGLVDMAKYNGAQYSKVEDEGAEVAAEEPVKDELKKKLLADKKWKSVRAEAGAKEESVTDGPKEKKLAKRKWQSVRAEAGAVTDGPKEKKLAKRKWQSVRAEAGAKEELVPDGPEEKKLAKKKWQSVRTKAGAKEELVMDGPKEKRLAKKKWQSVRAEAGAKEELVMDGPKEKASAKRKWMSFRN